MAETWPWGPMLKRAVAIGIGPAAFWRLSLKEWRMLTAPPPGQGPLGRRELESMMTNWPDRSDGHDGRIDK